MTLLHAFLCGAAAALALVATLFFVRYWRLARDRFFLYFSVAFALLGVNWAWVAGTEPATEARQWVYVLRLFAFLLILAGIIDKNRKEH
jgi:hypothetical protein